MRGTCLALPTDGACAGTIADLVGSSAVGGSGGTVGGSSAAVGGVE
ncbi:hypothetical protein [Kitasatospora sp. NPDC050463]